jgi:homoserine O-acetyltransferase
MEGCPGRFVAETVEELWKLVEVHAVVAHGEERFGRRNAADLHAQLRTWDVGDISNNTLYSGDLTKALSAITAKVLLLHGATDLYFRVADNEAELPYLRDAELTPIPSIWGHRAGNPAMNPEDAAFIAKKVRALLDD